MPTIPAHRNELIADTLTASISALRRYLEEAFERYETRSWLSANALYRRTT